MRVQFSSVFDYLPSAAPRVSIRYRPDGGAAGDGTYTVKRECGRAAVAAGKAKVVRAPRGGDRGAGA